MDPTHVLCECGPAILHVNGISSGKGVEAGAVWPSEGLLNTCFKAYMGGCIMVSFGGP